MSLYEHAGNRKNQQHFNFCTWNLSKKTEMEKLKTAEKSSTEFLQIFADINFVAEKLNKGILLNQKFNLLELRIITKKIKI